MTADLPLTVADQARGLREALEALSAALGAADAEAVLRAEAPLAAAVAACAQPAVDPGDAVAAAEDLRDAGRLLARCRASGAAIAALLDTTFDVLGQAAYDRQGARPAGAVRRHALQARG